MAVNMKIVKWGICGVMSLFFVCVCVCVCVCLNTKMVAALLNTDIGYFSVVSPSLGCLTLQCFDSRSLQPSFKISVGPLLKYFPRIL